MAGHSDTIANVYAAFARGDIPAVLAVLAPNASWTEAEGFPYAGTYVGPGCAAERLHENWGRVGRLYCYITRTHCQCRHCRIAWRVQWNVQGHGQEFQGSVRPRLEVWRR